MMKHSCRLDQFQLLNLLFILRVYNCGRDKNMLYYKNMLLFPGNTFKKGLLKHCFCISFLQLTEEVERDGRGHTGQPQKIFCNKIFSIFCESEQ